VDVDGVSGGVLVDELGRSTLAGVVAAGDCAARWSPRAGRRVRTEHWDDALHAPSVVAATLLGAPAVYDPVPYVWSEQFGHYLQWVGRRGDEAPAVWRGDPAGAGGWSAIWLDGDGRLTGVLAVDRPRDAVQGRRLIDAGATPDPDRLADPAVPLRSA
jgi:3-phenylpropionate/trans-cinnamate dioxygenase ferredoxin reductase subunit